MSDMLYAALAYEACGLSLLSWNYKQRGDAWDKVPNREWKVGVVPRMSSTDIAERWREIPDANIGCITGRPSDIIVLDADDERAAREVERLAPTPWVITTGRGRHFGYRYPSDLAVGGRILTGAHLGCRDPKIKHKDNPAFHKGCGPLCALDIRADGGYAAMPPSVHKTGRIYEWVTDLDDLSDILAQMPVFDRSLWPGIKYSTDAGRAAALSGDLDWEADKFNDCYADAAAWLAKENGAVSGNNGRFTTFQVAATLVREFALAPKQCLKLMSGPWNSRCEPEWKEHELVEKIEAGWRIGSSPIGTRVNRRSVLDMFGLGNVKSDDEPVPPEDDAAEEMTQQVAPQDAQQVATENVVATSMDLPVAAEAVKPFIPTVAPVQAAPAPASRSVAVTKAAVDGANELIGLSDEEFCLHLPAAAGRGVGCLFVEYVLNTCARLEKENKPLFHQLLADLKSIKAPVADFKRNVRDAQRSGGAKVLNERLSGDSRSEVNVGDDERDVRDSVLDSFQQLPGIYVSSAGKLSLVKRGALEEVAGGVMRNLIANNCRVVTKKNMEGMGTIEVPATMPAGVVQMLENLLDEQVEGKFREVRNVVHTPFFTPSGDLIATPGYDAETQTLLYQCPSVDPALFADVNDALEFLWGIFGDFPFMGKAEWANYVGTLLTPLVRTMYEGATMWTVVEANNRGIGKTWLGNCVQIVHGVPEVPLTMPHVEEEIVKAMLGYLMDGRSVMLFDNVKHILDSACLEAIATSTGWWETRGLGRNDIKKVSTRALVIIVGNTVTASTDFARRSLRVKIKRPAGARPKFVISNLKGFVRENRGAILSALVHIVQAWLKAERPVPESMPNIGGGYEEYARTVGAICHFAGLPWGTNIEEARRSWSINEEWVPFLNTWHAQLNRGGVTDRTAKELFDLCIKDNHLLTTLSKAADTTAKFALFTRKLNDLRDYDDGTFAVDVQDKGHGKTTYRLFPSSAEAGVGGAPACA